MQAADWGLDRKGVFGPTMKASDWRLSVPSCRRAGHNAACCRLQPRCVPAWLFVRQDFFYLWSRRPMLQTYLASAGRRSSSSLS